MSKEYGYFQYWQWAAALPLLLFFFWSRIDLSDRIYFFGDANLIIGFIDLIRELGGWDIAATEAIANMESTSSVDRPGYNFAGYIVMGLFLTECVNWLGFQNISTQTILHLANVVFQFITLGLIFVATDKLFDRLTAWLAVSFFVFFPLAIFEAHYARPETWLCFLAMSVFFCGLFVEKKPFLYYSLMGVFLGLSFSAKFNQLFLGVIPALLLLQGFFCSSDNFSLRINKILFYGGSVLFFMVLSVWLTTPFIVEDFHHHVISLLEVYDFYDDPAAPYDVGNGSYIEQLYRNIDYFISTLGVAWCLCFLVGCFMLVKYSVLKSADENSALCFSLVLLCTMLILYFSSLPVFFERSYSSLEGFIAIISAVGLAKLIYAVKVSQYKKILITLILMCAVFYTPIKLSVDFVQYYIHGKGDQRRTDFQKVMQKDFPEFWFKNVHESYNFSNRLPEKAPKADRLYVLKDYNGPWTTRLLNTMQDNGFVWVGEYRSEFYGLPTNNLTVYHQQHRYLYLVREDEIPQSLTEGYFKANF